MARMLYLRDIEVDVHVRCRACGHEGVLPRADMNRRFGPNYPVLSIAPHYRCSRCNSRDTESRPAPTPFATPVTATPMAEDAPSFAGPLAALQGLLDAVRTRGDAMDGPDAEDAAPVLRPPASAPAALDLDLDPDLDLELERLVADGGAAPESGRRPLWEPVSLADLAGHDEGEDDGGEDEDDEDWNPRRWTLRDQEADEEDGEDGEVDRVEAEAPPPAPPARTAPPAARDEPDDEASRSFDRTIAALRSILDGRGDGARAEEAATTPATPPAFSIRDAIGASQADDPEESEPDPDEDGAEPSNDDILGFAIRDPDKAPPPWERDRSPAPAGGEPLDRTIAALRSMVQKAAADRDGEDDDGDDDDRVVTPLFGRSRKPADDVDAYAEADDGPEDDEAEDRQADAEAVWSRGGLDDDADRDDAAQDDGAPVLRKSTQEQEMEDALRALRALVEAESDLDDPPRPAWKAEAPARPDADALPGFKPLPRRAPEGDEDDEPLDLVEPTPVIEPEKPKPGAGKRAEASESAKKAAKDDSGTLGKTLAALRNMLELDGKQGR
ncbi:hydrogenase maturation nickel metallochaperone HypA [Azospirillum brasilense]|uniref:hydrogenase maturation nickel metallochaperone HypA n=1 Tax=Azospirillum brasilense TaxID=192 RepID=UPI0013B3F140|nr:hydrogenase maturation nickel metallochaperone HypA [Azospirillum brasilense]